MIRYIYGDQLQNWSLLAESMFRDRATQFSKRLKWDVQVDTLGRERDAYDSLNPIYLIWEEEDGTHGGSMRFLPTVGQTMVNDHFLDLTGGIAIQSPLIWECTRFCVSPRTTRSGAISANMLFAAAVMGKALGLMHAVGVFDARMVRVYRALGWCPEILGSKVFDLGETSVGLWDFDAAPTDRLEKKAGISFVEHRQWLHKSLGAENRHVLGT